MIEINLLPANARTAEGTPPKRFVLYIFWVGVAAALAILLVRYHVIKIPEMAQNIKLANIHIEELNKQKAEVEKLDAEIQTFNQKIAVLDNLNLSRIRFARLFDRLTNATPEGVWYRAFSLAPDNTPSKGLTPAGKRFMISLAGYTTGNSQLERRQKFTELLTTLQRGFEILGEDAVPPDPVPPDYGFCKFVGVRFERPVPQGFSESALPALANVDPKVAKQVNPPKEGLDFSLTLTFELPPPRSGS